MIEGLFDSVWLLVFNVSSLDSKKKKKLNFEFLKLTNKFWSLPHCDVDDDLIIKYYMMSKVEIKIFTRN